MKKTNQSETSKLTVNWKQIEASELLDKASIKTLKKLEKKMTKGEKRPERGIETWFRLASKNLYTRRQIVDTKSNILITTNAIIISVVLGTLYTRLNDDPHLIYPIVLLVFTNIISIAYAIFATRPRINKGEFLKNDLMHSSLMTFDDFHRMSEKDYREAVRQLMENGELLYGTITKDIYNLGKDLRQRYQFIRISYDVFLYGIILSILAFGLCHAIY